MSSIDPMTLFLSLVLIISGGLLAYTYTKPGKRWLENL